MSTFEIYSPPMTGDRGAAAERLRVVKAGFSRAALLFAPFWLAWHRLWIALLVYVVAAVLAAGAVAFGLLPVGGAVALAAVAHALVAWEGPGWRGSALARRGSPLIDIVEATRAEDAAYLFLARLAPPAALPPAARDTRGSTFGRSDPQVLGLFPTPERRR